MAQDLTQAQKLTQAHLEAGVKEMVIQTSPLKGMYPFVDETDYAYILNRETVADVPTTMGFIGIGAQVPERTAGFTSVTFNLKEISEDADVPLILQRNMSKFTNQMTAQMNIKAKRIAWSWEHEAIYGVASGTHGFDGLQTLCASAQRVNVGTTATPANLHLYHLDAAFDMIKTGPADFMIMSKQMRRRLNTWLRANGSQMTERDEYGNVIERWTNGLRIFPSDWMSDAETIATSTFSAETGGASTSIIIGRFGEEDGIFGIENGGIQVLDVGKVVLERQNVMRKRILWYCSQGIASTLSLAIIDGIDPTLAVEA